MDTIGREFAVRGRRGGSDRHQLSARIARKRQSYVCPKTLANTRTTERGHIPTMLAKHYSKVRMQHKAVFVCTAKHYKQQKYSQFVYQNLISW